MARESCTHFEELAQRDVVQSVRAVEDNALLGHSFGQVFGRLRFSRASRALGGPSQMEVEGAKQSAEGETDGRTLAYATPSGLSVIHAIKGCLTALCIYIYIYKYILEIYFHRQTDIEIGPLTKHLIKY